MFKQTFKDSCGAFCKGSHGANLCWWLNQKLKILVNIYSIDFSLQVSYCITKKSMDKDSIVKYEEMRFHYDQTKTWKSLYLKIGP